MCALHYSELLAREADLTPTTRTILAFVVAPASFGLLLLALSIFTSSLGLGL